MRTSSLWPLEHLVSQEKPLPAEIEAFRKKVDDTWKDDAAVRNNWTKLEEAFDRIRTTIHRRQLTQIKKVLAELLALEHCKAG